MEEKSNSFAAFRIKLNYLTYWTPAWRCISLKLGLLTRPSDIQIFRYSWPQEPIIILRSLNPYYVLFLSLHVPQYISRKCSEWVPENLFWFVGHFWRFLETNSVSSRFIWNENLLKDFEAATTSRGKLRQRHTETKLGVVGHVAVPFLGLESLLSQFQQRWPPSVTLQ